MIEKPISVLRVEFIDALLFLVNNSELPPYVMEPILRDALMEVSRLTKEQFHNEQQEYQRLVAEEKARLEEQNAEQEEAKPKAKKQRAK